MQNTNKNQNLNDIDLGLGDGVVTSSPVEPVKKDGVAKVEEAASKAAAAAALKVAIEANSELAQREADKTYILEKKRYMLNRAKEDEKVPFIGQKIFADIFGSTYTFLYNTIPVTVKFDGSTQYFPKFVYDFLMDKINAVSESNTNHDETVTLNS